VAANLPAGKQYIPPKVLLMAHKVAARTVFIPKPPNLTYGDAMSCLRHWLDDNEVQVCGFKITTDGEMGFEIAFSREIYATRLEAFTWPRHPNARRVAVRDISE
jgi:hypothetical protein